MTETFANPQRGEVEIVLLREGREKRFVLRPSFAAVAEIEAATGKGILLLASEMMSDPMRGLSLSAGMAIVRAGLRAAGEKFNEAALQAMVFETGVPRLAEPCSAFLASAIRGGKPAPVEEESDPEAGEAPATDVTAAEAGTTDTPSVA